MNCLELFNLRQRESKELRNTVLVLNCLLKGETNAKDWKKMLHALVSNKNGSQMLLVSSARVNIYCFE